MNTSVTRVLESLNSTSESTLMNTLSIEYTDVGEDYLVATMPVTPAHHQPMGILHGGATAALAESVGSAASGLYLAQRGQGQEAVGLELSINHIRSVQSGLLTARAEAIHRGRSTHLWQIYIRDSHQRNVAIAKLTMMVIAPRKTS
ncbi:MAG: PaaI family thioesterase [Pseudomonadota bacterium]